MKLLQQAQGKARALRARVDAGGWDGPVLGRPACDRGCSTCYLRCAVTMALLTAWEREVLDLAFPMPVPAGGRS